MDEKELMSLGELYRELRVARGLKLRDVALVMLLIITEQALITKSEIS